MFRDQLLILELMDPGTIFFFVDHYTKYMWFYPIVNKFSVSSIFPHFKKFIETRFQTKIKALYSDNGTYHYTTTPHTSQQNGVFECRHRHLVETTLTLLHDASLDPLYWPHAF